MNTEMSHKRMSRKGILTPWALIATLVCLANAGVVQAASNREQHKAERKVALMCAKVNGINLASPSQPELDTVHGCIKKYLQTVSGCAKSTNSSDVPAYRQCEATAFSQI